MRSFLDEAIGLGIPTPVQTCSPCPHGAGKHLGYRKGAQAWNLRGRVGSGGGDAARDLVLPACQRPWHQSLPRTCALHHTSLEWCMRIVYMDRAGRKAYLGNTGLAPPSLQNSTNHLYSIRTLPSMSKTWTQHTCRIPIRSPC